MDLQYPPSSLLQNAAPLIPPPGFVLTDNFIARFWPRLLAFLIDALVIDAICVAITLPAFRFFSERPMASLALGFCLAFIYFSIQNSEMCSGQTLGKRALGLRVTDEFGMPISYKRSTLRFLVFAAAIFLTDVRFPCVNRAVCALQSFSSAVSSICEFALVYLFIFNRRTRQSLHDVVARTYVLKSVALLPLRNQAGTGSDGPRQRASSKKIWKGHWAVIGSVIAILLLADFMLVPMIEKTNLFSELTPIQSAIIRSRIVQDAGVRMAKNWSNGSTTTSIDVSVVPNGSFIDDEDLSKAVAAIVLRTDPKILDRDGIGVVVLHRISFGLGHYEYNRSFYHSPQEWQRIVGHEANGNGGTASVLADGTGVKRS